ncbi:hypothetical protein KKA27_04305 [Patescibacteria group bacterium]|nr:hypothetical protein [Patescibacteria group bacterium]
MVQKNNKNSKVQNIRTFRSDASDFVKEKGSSLTDLFMEQQRATSLAKDHETTSESFSTKTRTQKKILLYLPLLLLFVIGTSIFLFLRRSEPTPQEFTPPPPTPIITGQKEVTLEFSNKKLFEEQLSKTIGAPRNPGDLVSIIIKKSDENGNVYYPDSKEFLDLMQITPPSFVTSFIKENFFLGSLQLAENHPVLIFEIEKQQSTVFSGFLRWEENILSDLDFIVGNLSVPYSSLSFTDEIIKNQNARVIEWQDNIVFLYIFLDKKYIIITNSSRALEEIIRRFVLFKLS